MNVALVVVGLGTALGAGDPSVGEAEVLSEFKEFAERVAELPFVSLEFSVKYSSGKNGNTKKREYIGRFDFDPIRLRAYLEYLSFDETGLFPVTTYCTWNGRYGIQKTVRPGSDRRPGRKPPATGSNVLRSSNAPKPFGYAHFPCSHPYFPGLRSLASFLETRRVVVDRVSQSPDVYRVAVTQTPSAGEIARSWTVFYVKRLRPRDVRIVEQRVYFPGSPIDGSNQIPEGLELPESFQAGYLHSRTTYKDFREIGGLPFPMKWTLESPAGGVEADIDLTSLSLPPAPPEHGFSVALDEDDLVFDVGRRKTYRAGQPDTPADVHGMTNESQLLDQLEAAGAEFTARDSVFKEAYVPLGCAADCVFFVLATVGKHRPLQKISNDLGIAPGQPIVSLHTVKTYLERMSVESLALKSKPVQLAATLRQAGNIPTILHRNASGSPGHYFSVRDYESSNDSIQVLDPPKDPVRMNVDEIAELTTGIALLVDPAMIESQRRRLAEGDGRTWKSASVKCLSVAAVLGLLGSVVVFVFRNKMGKKMVRVES